MCKEAQNGRNFPLLKDMQQMNTKTQLQEVNNWAGTRKCLANVEGAISKQGKIFLLVSLPERICWCDHSLRANVANSPSANGLVVEPQIAL